VRQHTAVTRKRVVALVAIATLTVLVVAIVMRLGGWATYGAVRQGELDGDRRVAAIAPSPTPGPWAASVLAVERFFGGDSETAPALRQDREEEPQWTRAWLRSAAS